MGRALKSLTCGCKFRLSQTTSGSEPSATICYLGDPGQLSQSICASVSHLQKGCDNNMDLIGLW